MGSGEAACRPGLEPEGGVLLEAKKPTPDRPGSARLVTTPGAWMYTWQGLAAGSGVGLAGLLLLLLLESRLVWVR